MLKKKKPQETVYYVAETAKHTSRPFFTTDIVLSIPNVVIQPSVEEVQAGLNKAVQCIIAVSKGVLKWQKAPAGILDTTKAKVSPVTFQLDQSLLLVGWCAGL